MKNDTLKFYEQNSEFFNQVTLHVDMRDIYQHFLPLLPAKGLILDVGCGSGRDTLAFKNMGFNVEAFDGSEKLVQLARMNTGINVRHDTFESFHSGKSFDGIWACASLLHVDDKGLNGIVSKFLHYLKDSGFFYVSFKYGDKCEVRGSRFFHDMNEARLKVMCKEIGADIIDCWVTQDVRPDNNTQWLNTILAKNPK